MGRHTHSEPCRDTHPACWPEEKLLDQCSLTFSRASGPGGQHRNKVETSVQIEYLPLGIIATASERRTQNENRKVAILRLRCKLAVEVRPLRKAISTEPLEYTIVPSKTWCEYCRNGRVNVAETNSEWPALLAEVIWCLNGCNWDIGIAASTLETSSSQLIKLLKKYPQALALLNRERVLRGKRALV